MALTDIRCRQAKPKTKAYKLSDGGGLYLYVKPNGSRLWRWKYRFEGREKIMAFGIYPDVSLADARKAHQRGREVHAAGIDPMAQRNAERLSETMTFRVVSEKWFAHWKAGVTEKHAADVWRRLELDVLPTLGDIAAGDLSAA